MFQTLLFNKMIFQVVDGETGLSTAQAPRRTQTHFWLNYKDPNNMD